MHDIKKHILILDGKGATEAMAALTLRKQHADDRDATPQADSCEPSRRVHDPRKQYKPLDHAGRKDWDGIDPVYDEDMRQYDEEEGHIGPDELARRAIMQHPALVTIDGMQAYRFHGRYPYAPGAEAADPHAQDPNHLEYWMRRLGEELGAGEKLDAIVIPSRFGPLEQQRIQPFLARANALYPDLKVVAVQERALPDATSNPPLIDAVVTRDRIRDLGGIVRDLIGAPALPEPSPEDRVNRNLEAWRLKLLARGDTPASLPRHLKRSGDPGYVPPGDDKNGRGGRG